MGFHVEIDKINKVAEKYGLLVFADAAQAQAHDDDPGRGKDDENTRKIDHLCMEIARNLKAFVTTSPEPI